MKTIPKIVLTGGPCGGKSTGIKFLSTKLLDHGFYPIQVPEAPTILINAGITPLHDVIPQRHFEEAVVDLMFSLEAIAERAARKSSHPRPIIVCDRGIMDTKAYMPHEMFAEVIRERSECEASLHARYAAVFHLESAARGAEHAYTRENNTARFETLEEARLADTRTLEAWQGHPNLSVIDNHGRTFDQKLSLLWEKVLQELDSDPVEH